MFGPRDPEKAASYAAEVAAFDGTALDWQPGAEPLCGEALTFMESMFWVSTFGVRRCGVEPVQRPTTVVESTCLSIRGAMIEIRLHPRAARYTVFHELAHAANTITRTRDRGHGHAWRTWYVAMIQAAYGPDWARRLTDSFDDAGLSYTAPR